MPTSKILTPAQAEAVYSAMCALNNVGAKLKAVFGDAYGMPQGMLDYINKCQTAVDTWIKVRGFITPSEVAA